MWTEPKLCVGGVALPDKKSWPCESMDFWIHLGAGLGAFSAALLVSVTCFFWKKNKRCPHPRSHAVIPHHPSFPPSFLYRLVPPFIGLIVSV